MRAQSESILLSVDTHREKIERCDEILETLDTAFREKKELEGRLSKVEAFMREMKDDLKNLIKQLNG
jgi:F0F1-type ATP synthase membrane subunit b/b'